MIDIKNIQAELGELSKQQIRAVKDATFVGWEKAGIAAYDERAKRMQSLRAKLAVLDAAISG